MGVRRAVEIAESEAKSRPRVYTIGPLIHNPQALAALRERGVEILDEERLPGDLRDAVVIIRAHGIAPSLEEELRGRGARLVDATCPKVKASQTRARSLSGAGYRIFLAGEERHGELIGIQGYAPDCMVVATREEAEGAAERLYRLFPEAKTALLGQTTMSPHEYRAIGEGIRRFFPGLTVVDTICGATRDRQNALRELCARVDALIIAGGRESANTRRLLMIAEAQGKLAWLIETKDEIPPEIGGCSVVGLSAGASTPDEVIDDIEAALLRGGSGLTWPGDYFFEERR
jgi:4-hydroxy-3-methylbut-2-enyl diphosphate reductase